MDEPRPSLARRAVALLVLAVAGFLLVKWLVSLLAGLLTLIAIVIAALAVIWALRTL